MTQIVAFLFGAVLLVLSMAGDTLTTLTKASGQSSSQAQVLAEVLRLAESARTEGAASDASSMTGSTTDLASVAQAGYVAATSGGSKHTTQGAGRPWHASLVGDCQRLQPRTDASSGIDEQRAQAYADLGCQGTELRLAVQFQGSVPSVWGDVQASLARRGVKCGAPALAVLLEKDGLRVSCEVTR